MADSPMTDSRFLVRIEPSGVTFTASPTETLLDAALSAGIDFPHRCRQGVCTSCVCRLKSGDVRYDDPSPLSPTDVEQKFVYGCQAFAGSDLVLHHPFIRP
jgi:CDP-4-dehydro-6-deoxyglucose reductase/ring-1,2-phenylacetyl-CoA epoxidase subunit PaaE